MSYGNMHHVEIIQHKKIGEYKGEFITMMEAHRRAMTGTKSAQNRNIKREQIIQKNHSDDWQFTMALHINDLVSVNKNNGEREFYRVQKLDTGSNRMVLRLHTAAKLDNKSEEIYFSFNLASFKKWELKKNNVNVIGILSHD